MGTQMRPGATDGPGGGGGALRLARRAFAFVLAESIVAPVFKAGHTGDGGSKRGSIGFTRTRRDISGPGDDKFAFKL